MNELILLLKFAAPVAFAALGETVVQKSGVLNIGLEGTMLTSAYFGMLASFLFGSPLIGMVVGIVAGLLVSLIFGWFVIYWEADQIVVGTAVNLLALGLTGSLYRAKFGESGQLLSLSPLPTISGVDPVLAFLALTVPLVWWLLKSTAWGLAIRAAGEAPKAIEAGGFSVHRLRLGALTLGGALAGLGGAYLSVGVANSFAQNMTAGRGFIAIAMVTFGKWRPPYVFLAALLIGLAETMQYRIQALGWKLPYQLLIAMPYILALGVLVVVGRGTRAPHALGQPYPRQ